MNGTTEEQRAAGVNTALKLVEQACAAGTAPGISTALGKEIVALEAERDAIRTKNKGLRFAAAVVLAQFSPTDFTQTNAGESLRSALRELRAALKASRE